VCDEESSSPQFLKTPPAPQKITPNFPPKNHAKLSAQKSRQTFAKNPAPKIITQKLSRNCDTKFIILFSMQLLVIHTSS
jgi:hypothetical protein